MSANDRVEVGAQELTPEEYERERRAYEEQLNKITSSEMVLQSVVSFLNIGGRRMGLVPGSESARDLDQVQDAIDAVRALMPILERRIPAAELGSLREALSQLQLAYAREAPTAGAAGGSTQEGGGGGDSSTGGPEAESGHGGASGEGAKGESGESGESSRPKGPGPAESSGRLWVPGR